MIHQRGFTLLEVIIAITILAFISVFTATSIQSSFKNKDKIQTDIETTTKVRDALKIIERDVNLAFHYQNIKLQLQNFAEQKRLADEKRQKEKDKKKNPSVNDPEKKTDETEDQETKQADYFAPRTPIEKGVEGESVFVPKVAKQWTFFEGAVDKMNFPTLNNIRISSQEKTSNQGEVGYSVRSCKDILDPKKSSKCLWRRIANYIDDKPDEGGTESVLLENVHTFSLRYYNKKTAEWQNNWSTKNGLTESEKDHFPAAVEVKLSIDYPMNENSKAKPKEVGFNLIAPIRFTNPPVAKNYKDPSEEKKPGEATPIEGEGSGDPLAKDPAGGGSEDE